MKGIILSGGPDSVYEEHAFGIDEAIYQLGIPILGICYGVQLSSHVLGGQVSRSSMREYGKALINVSTPSLLFKGLPESITVWMS